MNIIKHFNPPPNATMWRGDSAVNSGLHQEKFTESLYLIVFTNCSSNFLNARFHRFWSSTNFEKRAWSWTTNSNSCLGAKYFEIDQEYSNKPDLFFLKCQWNEFFPLLFVTGKYANLRICIKILFKKTLSIRKSFFQLPDLCDNL